MKPIKLFVFSLFFVLLFSKVTLAQSSIISIPSTETYFDDDYVLTYERFNFYGIPIETKKSYNFSICNSGDSPLIISEISIFGEGFRLLNNETTITIEPSEMYYLFIEFVPTETKNYNGTITFIHNASNIHSPFSLPIVGTGLPFGTPEFWVEDKGRGVIHFNNVTVGKTVQYSLPLSNIGNGPLVISSIDVIPEHYMTYEEITESFSLPNATTPITIEPGNIYSLIVEFTPTKAVEYSAILSFTHNAISGLYSSRAMKGPNIYGTGIKEIIASADEPAETPTAYSLSQNYPNPFNPTTKIEYSLLEASNVRLAVYNNLGQEVASLVNEYQVIGKYIVDFNANNLPSGIYFYKIQAGNFNKTQKMVLMK